MARPSTSTNGRSRSSTPGSASSRSPRPDPIAEKIRELSAYDEEDDRDSSVNIHVEPGGVVHVEQKPDSAMGVLRAQPRWVRTAVGIVSALIGAASVARAIYEMAKR
jgi:hypothetical protein